MAASWSSAANVALAYRSFTATPRERDLVGPDQDVLVQTTDRFDVLSCLSQLPHC